MSDSVRSVRQTLQDFLAPRATPTPAELVAIRGELSTKIEAVESRLDTKITVLENNMNVLDSKIGSGFSALAAQPENAVLRGELSTTARSPTSVSALRGWKENAVRCPLSSSEFLRLDQNRGPHFGQHRSLSAAR